MDYVLAFMRAHGIPIARANYFAIDRPGADPTKPLDAESEAELPEQIQLGFDGWVN